MRLDFKMRKCFLSRYNNHWISIETECLLISMWNWRLTMMMMTLFGQSQCAHLLKLCSTPKLGPFLVFCIFCVRIHRILIYVCLIPFLINRFFRRETIIMDGSSALKLCCLSCIRFVVVRFCGTHQNLRIIINRFKWW